MFLNINNKAIYEMSKCRVVVVVLNMQQWLSQISPNNINILNYCFVITIHWARKAKDMPIRKYKVRKRYSLLFQLLNDYMFYTLWRTSWVIYNMHIWFLWSFQFRFHFLCKERNCLWDTSFVVSPCNWLFNELFWKWI